MFCENMEKRSKYETSWFNKYPKQVSQRNRDKELASPGVQMVCKSKANNFELIFI